METTNDSSLWSTLRHPLSKPCLLPLDPFLYTNGHVIPSTHAHLAHCSQ